MNDKKPFLTNFARRPPAPENPQLHLERGPRTTPRPRPTVLTEVRHETTDEN